MESSIKIAQELDTLRREFAQYRVEMALRLDKLDRRIDDAEVALGCAGVAPLLTTHTSVSSSSYNSTMPGFSEHRRHVRAPPPIKTAPAALAPAPASHTQTPARPLTPFGRTQQPPRKLASSLKTPGSRENAQYLPFAMEKVALASQKKGPGDRRTCTCGRATFDLKCFLEHHFDWCLFHQRPVIQGRQSCGSRDGRDCQPIIWEKHADWEMIVKKSFDSVYLGTKNVEDLYQVLFPAQVFPEKYEDGWYVG